METETKIRVLTDFDLHLMGEGNHFRLYDKLGAHVMDINNTRGVHFSVWAPNAVSVSVIGDFNNWDPKEDRMNNLGGSGIWELFIGHSRAGQI